MKSLRENTQKRVGGTFISIVAQKLQWNLVVGNIAANSISNKTSC